MSNAVKQNRENNDRNHRAVGKGGNAARRGWKKRGRQKWMLSRKNKPVLWKSARQIAKKKKKRDSVVGGTGRWKKARTGQLNGICSKKAEYGGVNCNL